MIFRASLEAAVAVATVSICDWSVFALNTQSDWFRALPVCKRLASSGSSIGCAGRPSKRVVEVFPQASVCKVLLAFISRWPVAEPTKFGECRERKPAAVVASPWRNVITRGKWRCTFRVCAPFVDNVRMAACSVCADAVNTCSKKKKLSLLCVVESPRRLRRGVPSATIWSARCRLRQRKAAAVVEASERQGGGRAVEKSLEFQTSWAGERALL